MTETPAAAKPRGGSRHRPDDDRHLADHGILSIRYARRSVSTIIYVSA